MLWRARAANPESRPRGVERAVTNCVGKASDQSYLLSYYSASMGGGGGRINKPKTSKLSTRTRARQKTKSHKHKYIRSEDTLSLTTDSVLRQCRYICMGARL